MKQEVKTLHGWRMIFMTDDQNVARHDFRIKHYKIGEINAELVGSDRVQISWPELNCLVGYVVR